MKKVRVLHVASFSGNIGDNANHAGAKRLRRMFLDFEFEITQKEIRESYWKQWSFNSPEFIAAANRHDLVMIGGGNYFELWVKNSATGTTVDLSRETLQQIKKPILFYSLGCDLAMGYTAETIEKFKKFLDYTTSNDNYFVSVRNDGALENIASLYKDRFKGKISKIPDGGFFMDVKTIPNFELDTGSTNVLINIAGDMLETRFAEHKDNLTYQEFIKKFAAALETIDARHGNVLNFIFAPHIFRDLKTIYDIIDNLSDKIRRKRVKVAPYLTGEAGFTYMFSLYKQVDLILGMRFHANVCAFALKKNVIGLYNYPQIKNLYRDIGSEELIEVNKNHFDRRLIAMMNEHLLNPKKYLAQSRQVVAALTKEVKREYKKLNNWLHLHF